MMNRLRTRLMISYGVVLGVTLAVIGIFLVILLRAQPVAREPIVARLNALATGAAQREVIAGLLLNAAPTRLESALDRLASNTNTRVLAATPAGEVIYDSLGVLNSGEHVSIQIGPARPDGLVEGSFVDNGQEWLFIGHRFQTRQVDAVLAFSAPRPESSWQEVLRVFGTSVLAPLLEAGVAGLVVALIMAWITSQSILRGLFGLRKAAGEVAAGHYEERVPVSGPDEVRDVAAAFNNMATQVQAAQVAQQDFLANVSHDLRTPLTSIQGFSQAIIDGTSKDPVYHARIIHDEAGRLNRLVGELLDLARISSGRLSLQQTRVDVGAVAGAVAERLAIKAREAGVQLVRDIQPAPEVTGDGDRLAQVLTNLIDNALKFTPQGGAVRVAVHAAQGGVLIEVTDTGQGIPAEDLPRIFERFYQVDKARGPRRGTGLGLAITAEIVRAHGGRIRADSGGPGKGTTITVWLAAIGMSSVRNP